MQTLEELVQIIFENSVLVKAVLSNPRKGFPYIKVSVRKIFIKGRLFYQWTYETKTQAFHKNKSSEESLLEIREELKAFKQGHLDCGEKAYQILTSQAGKISILEKPGSGKTEVMSHNREKNYVYQEGHPVAFLVELGIMNKDGKILPKKMDKFRQINRFLEYIADVIEDLKPLKELKIVDFGCGKAYLTFAVYDYLNHIQKIPTQMVGIDLKEDVINFCQKLAQTIHFEGLTFNQGSIDHFQMPLPDLDLMICLHACNTATDAAIEQAIRWKAKAILAAPCCQHELLSQVNHLDLKPLLKHGILKERLAALVTDAARAELLELIGYKTQVIEFIDSAHTPKNLLIKAIYQFSPQEKNKNSYLNFANALNIQPDLEKRLRKLGKL